MEAAVQVVGRKTVWLAPPSASRDMNPLDASLSNTSRVDVFDTEDQSLPEFQTRVVPLSQYAVLHPGDLLFFPPAWWHAMRSEDTSFSLSMWF